MYNNLKKKYQELQNEKRNEEDDMDLNSTENNFTAFTEENFLHKVTAITEENLLLKQLNAELKDKNSLLEQLLEKEREAPRVKKKKKKNIC